MRKIKTLAQFEKEWKRFKQEVIARPAFSDITEKAKEERRKKAEKDVWAFAEIYLPEYVKDKKADFHKEWDTIRRIKNEPVMIVAARGFGKSTFFTFLDVLYDICFAKSEYNLISSYVYLKAKIFTARIYAELKYNQKLISDFGKFFDNEQKQALGYFIISNKIYNRSICVQAISIGQDPRGLVFGAVRPTSIKMDDIQSYKKAKSKKNVLDSVNWLFLNILPAMEKDYKCHICATFLNDRCFASTLRKGDTEKDIPSIKTYIYPAEKKGKPTWGNKFPLERLKKLKAKMGTKNYDQEMRCIPKPIEGRTFDKENMPYFTMNDISGKEVTADIISSDLSMTSKGDFKSSLCIGLIDGWFYIFSARIKRERLSKHLDGWYEMYNQFNPEQIFFEDVTVKDGNISTVAEAIEYKEIEMGYPLPKSPIKNEENKIMRIEATLSALIDNKKILFNKDDPDQKILIDQLYEFPDGDNDDGPDSLEMGVRKLLELMRRRVLIPGVRKINRQSKVMEGY